MLYMYTTSLFLFLLLQTISSIGCPSGWIERPSGSDRFCYWLHTASSNHIWRDALWRCRESGGELFEPADAMEMRWLETQLIAQHQNSTASGVDWHVNAHRSLYSARPAWRSGRALDAFGNAVLEPVDKTECTYSMPNDSSRHIALTFDCAVLRLEADSEQFHLSYTSCIRTRRSTGFVCRRNADGTQQQHSSAAIEQKSQPQQQQQTGCGSEWITPANAANEYAYSITKAAANTSWFDALHSCRAKGAQLAALDGVDDANWLADQIDRRADAAGGGRDKFFVDLHEWLYASSGWAWRSSASLRSSSMRWATNEPDRRCQLESCAYMSRSKEDGAARVSDTFCSMDLSHMWLVCQRLRSTCSPHVSTSTRKTISESIESRTPTSVPNENERKATKTTGPFIIGGFVLEHFFVILGAVVTALVLFVLCLCCALCCVLRGSAASDTDSQQTDDNDSEYISFEEQSPLDISRTTECADAEGSLSPRPPPPPPVPIIRAPVASGERSATVRNVRSNAALPDSAAPHSAMTLPHSTQHQNAYVSNMCLGTQQPPPPSGVSQQAAATNSNENFSEYLTLQPNSKERVSRVLVPRAVHAVPPSSPQTATLAAPEFTTQMSTETPYLQMQVLKVPVSARLELLDSDDEFSYVNCVDILRAQ